MLAKLANYSAMILYEDDIKRLEQINSFITSNLEGDLSTTAICSSFAISKGKLQRHFKLHFKKSVYDYVFMKRMIRARILLNNKQDSIARIATMVGYKDRCAFTRAFVKFFNQTPVDYLK